MKAKKREQEIDPNDPSQLLAWVRKVTVKWIHSGDDDALRKIAHNAKIHVKMRLVVARILVYQGLALGNSDPSTRSALDLLEFLLRAIRPEAINLIDALLWIAATDHTPDSWEEYKRARVVALGLSVNRCIWNRSVALTIDENRRDRNAALAEAKLAPRKFSYLLQDESELHCFSEGAAPSSPIGWALAEMPEVGIAVLSSLVAHCIGDVIFIPRIDRDKTFAWIEEFARLSPNHTLYQSVNGLLRSLYTNLFAEQRPRRAMALHLANTYEGYSDLVGRLRILPAELVSPAKCSIGEWRRGILHSILEEIPRVRRGSILNSDQRPRRLVELTLRAQLEYERQMMLRGTHSSQRLFVEEMKELPEDLAALPSSDFSDYCTHFPLA